MMYVTVRLTAKREVVANFLINRVMELVGTRLVKTGADMSDRKRTVLPLTSLTF